MSDEATLLANLTSVQERCNELLEEARAARRERDHERAHVRHLQDDKLKLQGSVLFHLEELHASRREAEDLGKRLKVAQELLDKASVFARRVAMRNDNPPRWTEQAAAMAEELHEACS